MKRLLVLGIGVCLLASVGYVSADQKEDEAAIKQVIKEIFDTWNANDGEAMGALFDEPNYDFTGQTNQSRLQSRCQASSYGL